jgi:hypothetical protein
MCRNKLTGPGIFVPEQGLIGSTFFHTDLEEHDEEDSDDEDEIEERIYEERAVLIQSVENYQHLFESPSTSRYFDDEDSKEKDDKTRLQNLTGTVVENPSFGEQVIVSGMHASEISIGDIFQFGSLKLEITSPRLCCAWVDKRNGSPFGMKGIKRYCNVNGLGGFFARVLQAGELSEGSKLVRTQNPHPKWTLPYISQSLYGEGPSAKMAAGWPYWVKSKRELEELCAVEQLGRYEWKDEAQYILDNLHEYPVVKIESNYSLSQVLEIAQRTLLIHRRREESNETNEAESIHSVPSSSPLRPLHWLLSGQSRTTRDDTTTSG